MAGVQWREELGEEKRTRPCEVLVASVRTWLLSE